LDRKVIINLITQILLNEVAFFKQSMKIAILGGGSWGTALAVHLAKNNQELKVWEFFSEQAKEMQERRYCRLLPEVRLPKQVFVSDSLPEVLVGSELVLVAVPSDKVETVVQQAAQLIQSQPVIICSKGFASNLRLLSEAVSEKVNGNVFCLYGPTHAEEVGKGMFSGIVLAGGHGKEQLKELFENEALIVELSDDLIGVQVAAALKNILAVFVGVLDGMELGDNAKAFLITKGLEEIRQVGMSLGAKSETFNGLAGIGDIIVTCGSKHSRNRYVGQEVGKGRKLEEVIKEMSMVAEGVTTVKNAFMLKEKLGLKLPLITGVHNILFENKNPLEVLREIR